MLTGIGIDVRMVTGDQNSKALPKTRHEGQSLHEDGANYSNPGEATLNQEKFDADSPYLQVLARSSPGDKLTLARSLMFQIRRGAAS